MAVSRESIIDHIRDQYGVEPDFPWEGDPVSGVFRHKDNRKWFALIMKVGRDKLGLEGDSPVDCMNLKIDDPVLHDALCHEKGIIPSYHMNKRHWITVLLDGTVPEEKTFELIDISYQATMSRKKRRNS